jgi:hypothetical protein
MYGVLMEIKFLPPRCAYFIDMQIHTMEKAKDYVWCYPNLLHDGVDRNGVPASQTCILHKNANPYNREGQRLDI